MKKYLAILCLFLIPFSYAYLGDYFEYSNGTILLTPNSDVYTKAVCLQDGTNCPTSGSESDPRWTANSTTVARIGNCASGTAVQNTTTSGVECTPILTQNDGNNNVTSVTSSCNGVSCSGQLNQTGGSTSLNWTFTTQDAGIKTMSSTDQYLTVVNGSSTTITANISTFDARYASANVRLYFYNVSWNGTTPVNDSYTIMNVTVPLLNNTMIFNKGQLVAGENAIISRIWLFNITRISPSVYRQHTTINVTAGGAARIVRMHSELYKRNTSGSETLIGSSVPSDALVVTGYNDVDFTGAIPVDTLFNPGEYLVMRLNATVSGSGTLPTISVIVGDATGASLELGGTSNLNIVETDPIWSAVTKTTCLGGQNFTYWDGTQFLCNTTSSGGSGNSGGWSNNSQYTYTNLNVNITSSNASSATLLVKNAAGQTQDFVKFLNGDGVVIGGITSSAQLYIGKASYAPYAGGEKIDVGSDGNGRSASFDGLIYGTSGRFSGSLYANNIYDPSTLGDGIQFHQNNIGTSVGGFPSTYVGFAVTASPGQSGNLQNWINTSGDAASYINSSGSLVTTQSLKVPTGSNTKPSLIVGGDSGISSDGFSNVGIASMSQGGVILFSPGSGLVRIRGDVPVQWTAGIGSDPYIVGADTGVSRLSAGIVGIGTGASGSFDGRLYTGRIAVNNNAPNATLDVTASNSTNSAIIARGGGGGYYSIEAKGITGTTVFSVGDSTGGITSGSGTGTSSLSGGILNVQSAGNTGTIQIGGTSFLACTAADTTCTFNGGGFSKINFAQGVIGINDATPDAKLDVQISDSTGVGLIVQGAPAQSGDLQRWQNSSSGKLANIDANGNLFINNPTDAVLYVGADNYLEEFADQNYSQFYMSVADSNGGSIDQLVDYNKAYYDMYIGASKKVSLRTDAPSSFNLGLTAGGGATGGISLSGANSTVTMNNVTNGCAGIGTLVAGNFTVNTTCAKTSSLIFLTTLNTGALTNVGVPVIIARNNGNFTIKSTNAADTSNVQWWIVQYS